MRIKEIKDKKVIGTIYLNLVKFSGDKEGYIEKLLQEVQTFSLNSAGLKEKEEFKSLLSWNIFGNRKEGNKTPRFWFKEEKILRMVGFSLRKCNEILPWKILIIKFILLPNRNILR